MIIPDGYKKVTDDDLIESAERLFRMEEMGIRMDYYIRLFYGRSVTRYDTEGIVESVSPQ